MTTAADVERMVDAELRDLAALKSSHGIDASNIETLLLRPPRRAAFHDAYGAALALWIVLDEVPGSATEGYLVVYDEEEKLFGLGVKSRTGAPPCCIGLYGSFINTLNGM